MLGFHQYLTEAREFQYALPGTYRVYHGTDKKFDQFRLNREGEIWFTTDKHEATFDTARWLITADVTLKKPIVGVYGEEKPRQLAKFGIDSYVLLHSRLGPHGEYLGRGRIEDKSFDVVVFSPSQVRIVKREELKKGVREQMCGLTFAQMLTEATDQKTAIARLHALAKDHYDSFTHGQTVDVDYIFHQALDNPPAQAWNDLVTYREKVGGIKITNVPVKDLIPTQPGVSVTKVERLIKVNPNRWNADREEVVRIVKQRGKLYVMDGHHRASAAILMGYPTIPAELQPIS